MEEKSGTAEVSKEIKDANTCIAVGAGVGALGAASAALSGVVCPLCVFVAPGLIGYGAFKRWRCSRVRENGDIKNESEI